MNFRVLLVLGLMVTLGILLVIFTITHQRPVVPHDADHVRSSDPQVCLTCHGRGRPQARTKNHPLNDRCWECHQRAR